MMNTKPWRYDRMSSPLLLIVSALTTLFFLLSPSVSSAVEEIELEEITVPFTGNEQDTRLAMKKACAREAMMEFMEDNDIDPDNRKVKRFFRKTRKFAEGVDLNNFRKRGPNMVSDCMVLLKENLLSKELKKKGLGRWSRKSKAATSTLDRKRIYVLQGRWDDPGFKMSRFIVKNGISFSSIQDSMRNLLLQGLKKGGFDAYPIQDDPAFEKFKVDRSDPLLGYFFDDFVFDGETAIKPHMQKNKRLINKIHKSGGIIIWYKMVNLRHFSKYRTVNAKVEVRAINPSDLGLTVEPVFGEAEEEYDMRSKEEIASTTELAIHNATVRAFKGFRKNLREFLEELANE